MKRKYKTIPLEGRVFGKWFVVRKIETDKPGCWFECVCECGTKQNIPAVTLRAKRSTQCRNCNYKELYNPELMVGRIFGKWKVLEFADLKNKLLRFKCKCKCGNESVLYGADLRGKKTTQCINCHNRQLAKNNVTHGLHNSSTYRIWKAMLQRCRNPNCKTYKYYGGRGITVCERWLDFNNFIKDMGLRPEGLTIDRINNDGNYEPNNCRWVTHKVNCNNRHRSTTLR